MSKINLDKLSVGERLYLGINQLYNGKYFYYSLLNGMPRVVDTEIPTMAVGIHPKLKKMSLFYNPEFVKELTDMGNPSVTINTLPVILEHECLHVVFQHVARINNGIKYPKLYNWGIDMIVNNFIPELIKDHPKIKEARKFFYEHPEVIKLKQEETIVIDTVRNGTLSRKDAQEKLKAIHEKLEGFANEAKRIHWAAFLIIKETMLDLFPSLREVSINESLADELYLLMLKDQKNGQGEEEGGEGGGGSATGDLAYDPSKGSTGSHDGWSRDELDDETEENVRKQLKDAYERTLEHGQGAGNLPNDVQRMLEELLKAKRDWRHEINLFHQSCVDARRRRTWKRTSKRYGVRAPGRTLKKKVNIALVVDLSGSISPDIYADFTSHIKKILDDTDEAYVLSFDTVVHDCVKYKKNQPFPELHGGGGTMFQPVFDYIKEAEAKKEMKKIDGIIFFTDGYLWENPENLNTHGKRVIYAISQGGKAVDNARNVFINKLDERKSK